MFRLNCLDRSKTAFLFLFLAAALLLSGSPYFGINQAKAGENILLRHIAGDMPFKGASKKYSSKHSKKQGKKFSGMREMKAGHGVERMGKKKSKRHGGKQSKKHREVVKTVRYVSGGVGGSVRYGSAKRRHTVGSQTAIRASKSKVVRGRYGSADNSQKSGGGFANSGMIIVSINNNSNNNGMREIGGGTQAASAGATHCAYGSYCTIELGGPKIITFNDVGDIGNGALVDEDLDVPAPDIIYAK